MELNNLEIYKIAKEVAGEAWRTYEKMDWQTKKLIGDQWISAVDSIGANIAEGFGRFHYLDRNKFNLNARGSLFEAVHWTNVLMERNKINVTWGQNLNKKLNNLGVKLNNFISTTRKLKDSPIEYPLNINRISIGYQNEFKKT